MSKILKSMPMYDRGLRARVFPWTHAINTWVGYIYVFDNPITQDILIYFVPEEGSMTFHIHRTKVEMNTDGPVGYRLLTQPNPDEDPEISEPIVIDPAAND